MQMYKIEWPEDHDSFVISPNIMSALKRAISDREERLTVKTGEMTMPISITLMLGARVVIDQ